MPSCISSRLPVSALPAAMVPPRMAIGGLLTAGLCLSARLPNPEAHFEDVLLELAQRRYKGLSLEETLLRTAQANGYPHTSIRADYGGALKAAFSTSQLGGILANVATKFLLEGFSRVEQSWREITAIRPVNDFKPVESYRQPQDINSPSSPDTDYLLRIHI
jgi:hypothetical protein